MPGLSALIVKEIASVVLVGPVRSPKSNGSVSSEAPAGLTPTTGLYVATPLTGFVGPRITGPSPLFLTLKRPFLPLIVVCSSTLE